MPNNTPNNDTEQGLRDYADGIGAFLGLSGTAVLSVAREEHPGRTIKRAHLMSVLRAVRRAAAAADR
jgi:hypothetical protein